MIDCPVQPLLNEPNWRDLQGKAFGTSILEQPSFSGRDRCLERGAPPREKVEGTHIGSEQSLHRVGVVNIVAAEAVDGGEYLWGGPIAVDFSFHCVDHQRIEERWIALHVNEHGADGLDTQGGFKVCHSRPSVPSRK